ncbi:hypothetical protein BU16DRAFT_560636 [Lophium mytilinum]|uniref:Uncharacterized protein n=1 Tax=Lophium mytilinum TaxID=390894 RepID=A0A6A6QUF4_9PEZI|nr:hypothetical protein BU16DRAFT_560636 [Lophium mytilinum]
MASTNAEPKTRILVPQALEEGAKPQIPDAPTVDYAEVAIGATNTDLHAFRRLWNDELRLPMLNAAWEEMIKSSSNNFMLNFIAVMNFTCDGRPLVTFVWQDNDEKLEPIRHAVYLVGQIPSEMMNWLFYRLKYGGMPKDKFDRLSKLYAADLEAGKVHCFQDEQAVPEKVGLEE